MRYRLWVRESIHLWSDQRYEMFQYIASNSIVLTDAPGLKEAHVHL